MKKFIINLERRPERKEHFLIKNKEILGEEISFFKAIDKENLENLGLEKQGIKTRVGWRDKFKNRKITKGEVCCFISHFSLWRHCVQLNEPIMVFEDDAIINQNWNEQEYVDMLDKGYDFLYLSRNENEPEKTKSIDNKWEVPFYPYNMTAYVVTPAAAKKLISSNILTTLVPVDEYLPEAIQANIFKVAALKQDAANQANRTIFPSDIEPTDEEQYYIDFKTHVLTAGTDRKKCIPLNDSAARQGIYPKNLGTNVVWEGTDMSGPGGGMKINLVKKYIKKLPDNDLVLFTDAYDVFFADNLDTIINRFLSFNTRALFSGEQYCWPDKSLADQFPDVGTKYKFLNSGTYIAEVGELKRIFAEEIGNSDDDQLYLHEKYLSGKYDIKLDAEGYIFQTHEEEVTKSFYQLYNPVTNCCGCIYHGNGGEEAKEKFNALYEDFYPKSPSMFMPYIPNHSKIDIMDKDLLVVDFMTQSQCEDLIDLADRHGGWGSLSYDKFPAQEIRVRELGLWELFEKYWEQNLYQQVEEYWHPLQMYGLRDAFVMRYSLETQRSLSLHHDASLVTGSVKLNDDYVGADLIYPRQNFSNKDIPVGRCILFPGQVTHGHECTELISGVKYSLTMWTSRYQGDIL